MFVVQRLDGVAHKIDEGLVEQLAIGFDFQRFGLDAGFERNIACGQLYAEEPRNVRELPANRDDRGPRYQPPGETAMVLHEVQQAFAATRDSLEPFAGIDKKRCLMALWR